MVRAAVAKSEGQWLIDLCRARWKQATTSPGLCDQSSYHTAHLRAGQPHMCPAYHDRSLQGGCFAHDDRL